MKNSILIYGANGYTGQLVAKEAAKQGLKVSLAGRNEAGIKAIANATNFEYEIVDLENEQALKQLLKPFETVIHCAGPFSETAIQMVEACIATKTNYLDITGEIWVFEDVMRYHNQAEKAGIKLISGVGFDVVPTDCLAGMLKEALPDAHKIVLSFTSDKTTMSRGTAVTMAKNIAKGGYIRLNGKITSVPLAYKVMEVTFPHRKQAVMTIPWGDLMTTFHQTGIPNIEIYSGASKKLIKKIKRYRSLKFLLSIPWIQKIVRKKIEGSVTGPTEERLLNGKTYIVGNVTNLKGESVEMSLTTPEAYLLTAKTALKAATLLSKDSEEIKNGYLTPAQAFGNDFILQFDGVSLEK